MLIVLFKKRLTLGLYSKAFMNYKNVNVNLNCTFKSIFKRGGGGAVKGLHLA